MRLWSWGAAAAVVLAAVGGVVAWGNRDMAEEPVALVGTWQPVSIAGHVVDEERQAVNPREAVITFHGDGLTFYGSPGDEFGRYARMSG